MLAGFIETLADVEMDERQRQRCLALMREQANSMQRLVEDLLTLSALESEQSPVNESEFAIVPLAAGGVLGRQGASGGRHEVTLTIRDAATLLGSREELASAFGNLVSNAVRYTPEGGALRSNGGSPTAAANSRSPTAASASRRNTCRG